MAPESIWPGIFHATAVLESAMMAVSTTVNEPIKVAIGSFDLIGSTDDAMQPITFQEGATKPIELDVVVEVPRGSFLKRGSTGEVDFISPMPCPFNYGSVPQYLGREGDLLDAVVLGSTVALWQSCAGESVGGRDPHRSRDER